MAKRAINSQANKDEERKEYLEQRKLYIDLGHQVSQSFDKLIITLAGGALALSFTFIRQVVPQVKSGTLETLSVSWICLAFALLTILLSIFTSQIGMNRAIKDLDNDYSEKSSQHLPTSIPMRIYVGLGNIFYSFFGWGPLTQVLNLVSILLTFIGIVLLVVFGVQNIAQIPNPLQK